MTSPAFLRGRFVLPVLLALVAATPLAAAGTWTKLIHIAPQKVNGLVLLGDGTVMAARNNGSTIGKGWYRLTPDATGSYANGTWVALASMHDSRLYYATQVLKDGRVFVAGGEYGTGGPHAEVYDPQTDVWTQIDPPAALWSTTADNFVDSMAEILDDGKVLIMPVSPHAFGVPMLYDPATNTWSNAGKLKHNIGSQVEATWVKLPDHSILSIDPFDTKAQRYFADTNTWLNDGPEPVQVYDSFIGEMGGALLLPTGNAIFFGASGHNVLYTPTGTTALGLWTPAPDFPNGQGTPDAPAAMLVTGNVLCAVSKTPSAGTFFPSPTSFYEYDPIANSFTQVNGPTGLTDPTPAYPTAMLALPDGKALYSHMGNDLYVYDPGGAPLAAGKPVISAITQNPNGSWHIDGLQLNGISEGASYGDDLQLNSNYPMVRLSSGGDVHYMRSHDWSSTGVMTGSTPVSTEFDIPVTVTPGTYSLEVVANGIASDPVPFTFTVQSVGSWASSGAGLAGLLGVPVLTGSGTQKAGDPATLKLASAMPSAISTLFVGFSSTPTPFKGGTLYPVPIAAMLPFVTDSLGSLSFSFPWPTGVPTGFSLFWQYGIKDFAAIHGVSLSNALQSTSP